MKNCLRLRSISKFITLLSIMFIFICGFYNNVSANEYTYDPSPVEGYHKALTSPA